MASNYRLSQEQHEKARQLVERSGKGRALGHTVVAREIGIPPATFEQALWGGGHTACDIEGGIFVGNGHTHCDCPLVFYQGKGWTRQTYEKIAAFLAFR